MQIYRQTKAVAFCLAEGAWEGHGTGRRCAPSWQCQCTWEAKTQVAD